MKMEREINTFCPFCRKHTLGTVKEAKGGKRRTMSRGQLRHIRKTKGYTSKIAGKKEIKKVAKRIKIMITCKTCSKKHERMFPRSKKKIEIKKEE